MIPMIIATQRWDEWEIPGSVTEFGLGGTGVEHDAKPVQHPRTLSGHPLRRSNGHHLFSDRENG
jgi:hypothetical protein